MSIEKLIELSRFYGSNSEYTLAGGGNTSFKDEKTLCVKASGASLSEADEDSFVKMDRASLSAIWDKTYPAGNEEREKEVLADLMAARENITGAADTAGQKRPSVEALLHDIIPFSFVVHLHPALVNGLCCSQNGEKAAEEIFGNSALWIPSENPGYILSRLVKTELDEYYKKHQKNASVILLQNHGIFAGADTADGIKYLYNGVMSKINAMIKRKPDFSDEVRITQELCESLLKEISLPEQQNEVMGETENFLITCNEIMLTLKELGGCCAFMSSKEIILLLENRELFYPVSSAFTPDHIVYSGSDPLFAETKDSIRDDWEKHVKKTGRNPKITAIKNMGVFGTAANEKACGFALDLFKDSVKTAVYAESFGGPLFMAQDKIDFINNWEVERYRSSVSTK